MRKRWLFMSILAVVTVCRAEVAYPQTADDIVEKHLAAMGGRAALEKVTSRVMTGIISASTPGGDLRLTPKTGPSGRMFIDAETYLLAKTIITVNVPQIGGDVEQTVVVSDYHNVDGVTVPYQVRSVNQFQTISITATKVEQNMAVRELLFAATGFTEYAVVYRVGLRTADHSSHCSCSAS